MNKLFDIKEDKKEKVTETVEGYQVDEVISALQKEIRRGNEFQAAYWCVELMESKLDFYMWRRLKVIAAEDVENPMAVSMVCQNEWAFYKIGKDSDQGRLIAIKTIVNLCREPKDRTADDMYNVILEKRKSGDVVNIPDYAVDCHTKRGRKSGRGLGHFWHVGSNLENESPNYNKKYLEYFRKRYPHEEEVE